MTCTEAYKEHIEYTFNAFCRVVIHYDPSDEVPKTESVTAKKLMHIDSVMLTLMVFTVALDKRFK